MDSPLIGITMFERNFEAHFSLPAEFVESVRRAGGIPVLMPPGEPHLDQWFETIDAGPGYHIRKVRYEAVPGMWIPALLYEPDDLSGKVPVVLNVNGETLNRAWDVWETPGKIALQSEGAEIHFRNIRLAPIE